MIVGLTGGIGSGKSTVASMLAERGATVVDADALARIVVEPGTPTLDALVQRFGPMILHADGTLNRGALAGIAFADPSGTEDLNAIMHPAIAQLAHQRLAASDAGVVVYDMPLLVETGQAELVDFVVVVDVAPEIQMERALARGLWDAEDIERRIAVQADRETRLAHADYVVSNDGDRGELAPQVDDLWRILTSPSTPKSE